MDTTVRRRVAEVLLATAIAGGVPITSGATPQQQPTPQTSAVGVQIDRLIQQLGAPEYSTREKAQMALEQLGLEAFDALNAAQTSDDIEIAMRARYLVRSMQVHWAREEDSVAVKQILSSYGSQPEDQRRLLLQQLATLGVSEALAPLCRLTKYEQSQRLSRRAALLIMQADLPEKASERRVIAQQILAAMSGSKRAAASWLRAHAASLQGREDSLQQWDTVIANELASLHRAEDNTNRRVVRDLLWWYADRLSDANKPNEALNAMRRSIELLDSQTQELLAAVDWFRTRKAWDLVVAVSIRYPAAMRRSPLLMYRLADSQDKLDQHQQALQSAELAAKAVPDEPREHLMVAANLQHDGLFQWAENEYRHVLGDPKQEPLEAITARFLLSEMYHDLERHQDAGNVLKQLVDAIESDEELRDRVESDMGREVGGIKSRMLFFLARAAQQQGDVKKPRELLTQAIASDPTDADVLIAMYRLRDADDKWKTETRARVKAAADHYKKRVGELEKMLQSGRADQRVLAKSPLATACNQYAWLIANTEGKFDEAVRMSERSLTLRPNTAGYLDTLAHCYFAVGDYAKAVETQSRAAVLEPHSPQILAKLEVFKKAQDEHVKPSTK